MKPEISIVIPLYNKEKYIQRAIESVLCQTSQNFECIIIDSSTDASTILVNGYSDPRIIHITCEKSTAANARNRGVLKARSDLIAFLDADDEWQPEHLETLIMLRKHFPDAGLLSTPYIKLKQDGTPMVMLFVGIRSPPWEGYLEKYLQICSRGDEPVHSSSCAMPRQIFETMGGFPEDVEYGEDQYLWGKIALSFPIAYSWKGLAIYHTEAMDRICDKPHRVKEHPFSSYLKRELMRGTIPKKFRADCLAYIRRKRFSEIFSTLLITEELSYEAESRGKKKSSQNRDSLKRYFKGPVKCISHLVKKIYDSSFHDKIRMVMSRIYQCHIPPLNVQSDEK
jgi:glycosyltransferase involved in cell wall biosynthesis